MQQLRFCLCLVARAVAGELGRVGASWGRSLTMFKPALRKTLFVAFSDWSEEGSAGKCLPYYHYVNICGVPEMD